MSVPDKASLFVHDERMRNTANAERLHVAFTRGVVLIQRHHVIHLVAHLFNEWLYCRSILVSDADKHHVLAELFCQFRQMRNAGAAGRTPGGPEFYYHDLLVLCSSEVNRFAFDPF